MDLVKVGQVGPARGLKGEVLVRPFTDYPEERFRQGAQLVAEDEQTWEVSSYRQIKGRCCLTFSHINNRDDAEAIRGIKLYAPASSREGEYSPEQLTGLRVQTPSGEELGKCVGVAIGGFQDRLQVDTGSANPVEVPLVKALVPTIDLDKGIITVDAPEGLF